jgi:hypothetical protein
MKEPTTTRMTKTRPASAPYCSHFVSFTSRLLQGRGRAARIMVR